MGKIRQFIAEENPFFFATPSILWQLLFLYIPLIGILCLSFLSTSGAGLSFEHYTALLSVPYFKVLINSFILASCTAFCAFMIAYPVAYYIALYVHKKRILFLIALILPSWTNFVVQIYAWFFLLERNGVYSRLFYWFGITKESVNLLNSYGATLACMVYCFVPFMIFPIYVVLDKMDKRLIEASSDLGASRLTTFLRVVLPLSMPGVYVGLLLVFIPAFGEFAIPALVGGAKHMYWGTVIVDKFLASQDWASGFAFTSLGVLTILICMLSGYGIAQFFFWVRKHTQAEQVRKNTISSQQDGWGFDD